MPINEAWHQKHPMPKRPSLEQRNQWHREHAEQCGCRPIPTSLKEEIEGRSRAGR